MSAGRADKYKKKTVISGALNSEKLLKIREKVKLQNLEEEKRVLAKLGNLTQNIEKTRVLHIQLKREEIIKETVEKINESRKQKMLRWQNEQKKEEEKIKEKEKELKKKEDIREKVLEQTKYWNSQHSLYLSEVNCLKKIDQQHNYLKNQESLLKLKERVFEKHKKHDIIREKLKSTQKKIKKIKEGVDSEISLQREKNLLTIKESIENIDRKSKMKKLEPTFMLTEPE